MAEPWTLTEERRARIVARLDAEPAISARALSADFGVSVDTVQRDLVHLERAGALRRVRGGAVPIAPPSAEFGERTTHDLARKRRFAREAAGLLEPRATVGFAGGTTILALCDEAASHAPLTVLTTSLEAATRLAGMPGVQVDLPAGRVHARSRTVYGADTVESLRGVRLDRVFVSACSLHPQEGLSMEHREEAGAVRALLRGAGSVVVFASQERVGTATTYPVLGCGEIDIVISDGPPDVLAEIAAAGPQVRAV